jgi:hypothetical protein
MHLNGRQECNDEEKPKPKEEELKPNQVKRKPKDVKHEPKEVKRKPKEMQSKNNEKGLVKERCELFVGCRLPCSAVCLSLGCMSSAGCVCFMQKKIPVHAQKGKQCLTIGS